MEETAVTQESNEKREDGGERREQTDLRSFIFLAIIFFREKNPSPFHFVFISVVNASNETSDLQRCSRKDESSSAPPLFRIVTGDSRRGKRGDIQGYWSRIEIFFFLSFLFRSFASRSLRYNWRETLVEEEFSEMFVGCRGMIWRVNIIEKINQARFHCVEHYTSRDEMIKDD